MNKKQLLLIGGVFLTFRLAEAQKVNNRPTIGILAEETDPEFRRFGHYYISSSYVKFIESAGARAVPIRMNRSDEYYIKMFKSVNGVLFPGGGLNIKSSSSFKRAGKIIFEHAKQANDAGDHFPIWGTCLGFEMLNLFLTNGSNIFTKCSVEDIALPLNFLEAYWDSRIFEKMPLDLVNAMRKESITSNFHHNCFLYETFRRLNLQTVIKALTTSNSTSSEKPFLSTIEAVKYPFYGLQWHPEKTNFVWVETKETHNIPHSKNSILASQYMANFFVDEARKNFHSFKSTKELQDSLSYNFEVKYIGKYKMLFEQIYIVPTY
ncbi:Gamma-glutamyl hydrolase [Nymphon striatum]|nr:Gamma-glutamyl hydrolase [Nymphon striatum]